MSILKRAFIAVALSIGFCLLPGAAFASAQPDPLDHAALSAQQYTQSSAESDGSLSVLAATSAAATGIDVSSHQGQIDWEAVKASGVQYAIIRIGYGGNWADQDDSCFAYNASECERLGIPYGVYLYSYAGSTADAKDEADHVIRLLQGHHPQYPVYWDLEYQRNDQPAGFCNDVVTYLNNSDLAANAKVFCEAIYEAGYIPGIYANLNWWNNYLTDSCFDSWERWVAQYNTTCDYAGAYAMWQCSSTGTINGISGNVDVDYDYRAGRVSAGVSLGDANGNGTINIVDAQIAYDVAQGAYGTEWSELAALRSSWSQDTVLYLLDVNRNGYVDAGDAFAIQYLALHQQ